MRPPSRCASDLMDPIIRRTLRSWALSKSLPTGGRRRLLTNASAIERRHSGLSSGLSLAGALTCLRSAFRSVHATPPVEIALPAYEYVLVRKPPTRFVTRTARQERWHMFSFDVMVLTLIR